VVFNWQQRREGGRHSWQQAYSKAARRKYSNRTGERNLEDVVGLPVGVEEAGGGAVALGGGAGN